MLAYHPEVYSNQCYVSLRRRTDEVLWKPILRVGVGGASFNVFIVARVALNPSLFSDEHEPRTGGHEASHQPMDILY
jgi:hypothetical protein